MALQHDDAPALRARELLQPPEEINLLGGVERLAEGTHLAEGGRLAEHERAGSPLHQAADRIPHRERDAHVKALCVVADRGAAGEAVALLDRLRRVIEELRRRPRIGVDEEDPVAARLRRAGVARAGDLVHRLEHHGRAGLARDGRGAVGGIVVADDELGVPAPARERRGCRADGGERLRDELLLVECRDDDRELHL